MNRRLFSIILIAIASNGIAQITATDFTATDCNNTSYNLFNELDSGKLIVICWVMPCGTCVGIALSSQNIVESYQTTHPDKVYLYLVDDFANTDCISLNSWANSNGINNSISFSDTSIKMSDYAYLGMPKTVVLYERSVLYMSDYKTEFNAAALKNAIDLALTPAKINELNTNILDVSVLPNPAINSAGILFHLTKTAEISIELFDLEGKMLKNAFSGRLPAGENTIQLNLTDYAPGIYLVRLTEGTKSNFINLVVSR